MLDLLFAFATKCVAGTRIRDAEWDVQEWTGGQTVNSRQPNKRSAFAVFRGSRRGLVLALLVAPWMLGARRTGAVEQAEDPSLEW